jgi:5-methylcytosine-specific restriction endonuclease McrA
MSKFHQKTPRLKLPLAEYLALRNQVLQRDGWRCQLCRASNDLHVHHVKSRSSLGDDTIRNLITLCAKCHESFHRHTHSIDDDSDPPSAPGGPDY